MARNELLNHFKLRGHPHIVGFKEAKLNATSTHVCIVLEKCEKQTLLGLVPPYRGLAEPLVCTALRQMTSTVAYKHSLGISNRDVKVCALPSGRTRALRQYCFFGSRIRAIQAPPSRFWS